MVNNNNNKKNNKIKPIGDHILSFHFFSIRCIIFPFFHLPKKICMKCVNVMPKKKTFCKSDVYITVTCVSYTFIYN